MSPQCNVLDLSSDQFYSFMAPFVHVSDIVLFNAKYIGHVYSSMRILSDRHREIQKFDINGYNRLTINQPYFLSFIIQFSLNMNLTSYANLNVLKFNNN